VPARLRCAASAAEVLMFAFFFLICVIVEYRWMLKLWGEEMKLELHIRMQ
jgi:uncharacterized membrane protein